MSAVFINKERKIHITFLTFGAQVNSSAGTRLGFITIKAMG